MKSAEFLFFNLYFLSGVCIVLEVLSSPTDWKVLFHFSSGTALLYKSLVQSFLGLHFLSLSELFCFVIIRYVHVFELFRALSCRFNIHINSSKDLFGRNRLPRNICKVFALNCLFPPWSGELHFLWYTLYCILALYLFYTIRWHLLSSFQSLLETWSHIVVDS